MNCPEIVDLALPAQGVFHNLVFVSIKKTYPMRRPTAPGKPFKGAFAAASFARAGFKCT
jgi:UbiD family decarboxylase